MPDLLRPVGAISEASIPCTGRQKDGMYEGTRRLHEDSLDLFISQRSHFPYVEFSQMADCFCSSQIPYPSGGIGGGQDRKACDLMALIAKAETTLSWLSSALAPEHLCLGFGLHYKDGAGQGPDAICGLE